MNSDQIFEARLEQALRDYGEQALLPFDPEAIAEQAMGTERRAPWLRAILVPIVLLVLLMALAIGIATLTAPDPDPRPSPAAEVTAGLMANGAGDGHTATLLEDGRLLVLHGSWESMGAEINGSAELWDPSTGTTAGNAGEMLTPRHSATATLLTDGRVLMVGGFGGPYAYASSAVASAELWDPATSSFTETGALAHARVNHTATLLSDGRILIVGGSGPDGVVAAAELYDPVAGTFQPAGDLGAPRTGHTATVLADGRVLVLGGITPGDSDGSASLTAAEVWDPATQAFTNAGEMTEPRQGHSATLLSDGRVLVVGGYIGAGYTTSDTGVRVRLLEPNPEIVDEHLASAETWDPATATFSPTGSLQGSRTHHTATLIPDGRAVIIGGTTAVAEADAVYVVTLASVEVWDPATGVFEIGTPLEEPRHSHSAVMAPGGALLIVGGSGETMDLTTVEVWRP